MKVSFSSFDPRLYQVAVLGLLVGFGVLVLDFGIEPGNAIAILVTAQAAQYLGTRFAGLPHFDPRSALVTTLSLILLFRTDSVWLAALAAAIAIGSKFLIRINDKHVFNPANIAIVSLMLVFDGAWISTGQWGSATIGAFALACLGFLVLTRARRAETTVSFLFVFAALLIGRALWLGDPLVIPLHHLQNGALLIFAFFMISDPRTAPNGAAGRIAFGAFVATVSMAIQFVFYQPNGPVLALILCAPFVPLIDRLSSGERYRWQQAPATIPARNPLRSIPMRLFALIAATAATLGVSATAQAFCGFYVARADTGLYNKASQVVLVRDDDRTVITMANDFQGNTKDFAVVVPVPTFIEREQINVADRALIDHLDAYTAPRLVEYHDPDPCLRYEIAEERAAQLPMSTSVADMTAKSAILGVTIEARYTVGEYDILILSAAESNGLIQWLQDNGYRIPEGAAPVVKSYLRQDMRFFVAKVNLEEQARLGFANLRPLQVAYESSRFMLPIRLGTVNAKEAQELFVYTLTRTGRVETTNYRTVRLPSDQEVPEYVEHEFGDFYQAMFAHQTLKENGHAVFLEYAWDMAWCDPCAADPLAAPELGQLGVFWIADGRPPQSRIAPQAHNVFVTRLHVRYDQAHFPEDLMFQETGDRSNFQGRYVIRRPFTGPTQCDASEYRTTVRERQEREAQTLATLTGWSLENIRDRITFLTAAVDGDDDQEPWWKRLWN